MEKDAFDICYYIGNKQYLAPQLLDYFAPSFGNLKFSNKDSIHFRLEYDFMPKGILTRLIVKNHSRIWKNQEGTDVVWDKGVVLYMDQCYSKIVENENRNGTKFIDITIKGKSDAAKKQLFYIKKEILNIHEKWFPKISFKELVKCYCKECFEAEEPHFFQIDILDRYLSKGKAFIDCPISVESVGIEALLNTIIEYDKVLKHLKSKPVSIFQEVEVLITRNELVKAVTILKSFNDKNLNDKGLRNFFIQTIGRLRSIDLEHRKGNLSSNKRRKALDPIRFSILETMSDMQK